MSEEGSPEAARYREAAEIQRSEIDLARGEAADFGCDRAIAGEMIAECAGLNAKIDEMARNLEDLESRLAELSETRERARLLDALAANDCPRQEPDAEAGASDQDLFEEVLGGTIIRGGASRDAADDGRYPKRIVIGKGEGSGGGEFRTLCVRTCDGYFFPMSNGAALSDFERDQKRCEAACPGTELFYHLADGEAQEDMVSARTAEPYRELPSAYRYKRTGLPRTPDCGCNARQDSSFSILAGEGRPIPQSNKAPVDAEKPMPATPAARPDPDRKVRVVGPKFLPDPPGATDLRVPVPTPVQ
ncbi:DUF2865 domain-containing protein [Mesorhizobium sp. CC13]|uniref:DUF2865 domain-containing protein n=1 Tax=Mesorhizobium sp. CC13 TaxID=3029194 RepID=UPI003267A152